MTQKKTKKKDMTKVKIGRKRGCLEVILYKSVTGRRKLENLDFSHDVYASSHVKVLSSKIFSSPQLMYRGCPSLQRKSPWASPGTKNEREISNKNYRKGNKCGLEKKGINSFPKFKPVNSIETHLGISVMARIEQPVIVDQP